MITLLAYSIYNNLTFMWAGIALGADFEGGPFSPSDSRNYYLVTMATTRMLQDVFD